MFVGPIETRQEKVVLPNGLALNVVEWLGAIGTRSSYTVLLIHGLGDAACVWRDVAPRLAGRFRVLAVDLRGHGDSDWVGDGIYKADAMATDISHLMRLLAIGRMAVVGHSLGGAVALRLASMCPSPIERVILADFGPDADPKITAHLRQRLRDAHRRYSSVEDYAGVLAERMPLAAHDLLQWIAKETTHCSGSGTIRLKYDPAVVASREPAATWVGSSTNHSETWRLLSAIRCPVLVLRGTASSVLSAKIANRMAHEVLSRGTLSVIPLAGHSIQIENPAAVGKALESFLDSDLSLSSDAKERCRHEQSKNGLLDV
ncbi:MAG: alpha/beta hydrolase [Methylocella sp.]